VPNIERIRHQPNLFEQLYRGLSVLADDVEELMDVVRGMIATGSFRARASRAAALNSAGDLVGR
jgi:hypothetical protein